MPARFLIVLLLTILVSSFGCAEERPPINQVQAGAVPKSFFVGDSSKTPSDDPEFYFRTTVVDVAAGAGSEALFTSSDAQPTVAHPLGDHRDQAHRAPRPTSSIDDGRPIRNGRAAREAPQTAQIVAAFTIDEALRHPPRLQPDDRRREQRHRRERHRSSLEPARVHPRRLVEEPRHRRLRSRHASRRSASTAASSGIRSPTTSAIRRAPTRRSSTSTTATSTSRNKAFAAPQIIHDAEYGDFPAC